MTHNFKYHMIWIIIYTWTGLFGPILSCSILVHIYNDVLRYGICYEDGKILVFNPPWIISASDLDKSSDVSINKFCNSNGKSE